MTKIATTWLATLKRLKKSANNTQKGVTITHKKTLAEINNLLTKNAMGMLYFKYKRGEGIP